MIMENIWTLVAEFAFLGLIAYGYYLYQKSKIIRNDKIEIFETVDEMVNDLDAFINTEQSSSTTDRLKEFSKSLRESNDARNYEKMSLLLKSPPACLPDTFSNAFPSIDNQVSFHIKKK